jgi:hypothetical protein
VHDEIFSMTRRASLIAREPRNRVQTLVGTSDAMVRDGTCFAALFYRICIPLAVNEQAVTAPELGTHQSLQSFEFNHLLVGTPEKPLRGRIRRPL